MSSFLSFIKKRIILKILSYFSTASLLLTFVILPAQPVAHADIVSIRDQGAAGLITGYGAWNGTSLAFDFLDDFTTPLTRAGELISGLWDQAYVELGTLPTYSDLGEYYASGVIGQYSVYGTPYAEITLTSEMVGALDVFWDWLLTKAGLQRNSSGQFVAPDTWVSPIVNMSPDGISSGSNPWDIDIAPFSYYSGDLAVFTGRLYDNQVVRFPGAETLFIAYQAASQVVVITSRNPVAVNYTSLSVGSYNWSVSYNGSLSYTLGDETYTAYSWLASIPSPVQSASNYATNLPNCGTSASIRPWLTLYDGVQAELRIVSDSPTGEILLPNPYAEDYVPQPLTIPTVIPYPPEYAPLPVPIPDPITGDFPEDAPDPEDVAAALSEPLMQGVVDEDVVQDNPELDSEPEPSPVPSPGPGSGEPVEVVTPFLPVQFPSFNFSLSGIWHYVVEWVGTLGSWFSMVFTIWSHLPYAIVVPVYATAVVVIVLGVYKRFFM